MKISKSVDILVFSFWDNRIFEKQNVCFEIDGSNKMSQKLAYLFLKNRNFTDK